MVKYLSKHHSAEDPGGLIHEVLRAGPEFTGPAEDVILSWMLSLEDDRDPAEAARVVLQAHDLSEGPLPDGAAGRVVTLLREAARATIGELRASVRRRARRTGRPRGPAGR